MAESSRKSRRSTLRRSQAHLNAGRQTPRLTERDFDVPPSLAGPKAVFVNCHYCGYSPTAVPETGMCPKCGGHSWERFTLSKKLIAMRGKSIRPR